MRTISINLINTVVFLGAIFLAANKALASEACEHRAGDKRICIEKKPNGRVDGYLKFKEEKTPIIVARNLKRKIRAADELFFLANKNNEDGVSVLVLRLPSVTNRSRSYCGAGSEDFLTLLNFNSKTRVISDVNEVIIQSCLNDIYLADDSGRDLKDFFDGQKNRKLIQLRWLNHPEYGDRTMNLVVHKKKLMLIDALLPIPGGSSGKK